MPIVNVLGVILLGQRREGGEGCKMHRQPMALQRAGQGCGKAPGAAALAAHPIPRRPEIVVQCTARMVDSREVTSSNGERERRVVIETDLVIAGQYWPIEITLTNRALMRTRMLLGRQALAGHVLIDPALTLHQPRLSYKVYRRLKSL
jgi:Putative ATP-dependant zinc protease